MNLCNILTFLLDSILAGVFKCTATKCIIER